MEAGPTLADARLSLRLWCGDRLSSGVKTSLCSVNRAATFLMKMFLQNYCMNVKKDSKLLELICMQGRAFESNFT